MKETRSFSFSLKGGGGDVKRKNSSSPIYALNIGGKGARLSLILARREKKLQRENTSSNRKCSFFFFRRALLQGNLPLYEEVLA